MLERARQLPFSRPASFVAVLALLGYVGCSNDSTTEVGVTHPTLIEVSPEYFLGDLPCAVDGGPGLKRYVASAYDVTDGGAGGAAAEEEPEASGGAGSEKPSDGFKLPSSMPVSCRTQVGFGFVVAGRSYRIRVDGYDTEAIMPRATGSRIMVPLEPADGSGAEVTPVWRSDCRPTVSAYTTVVVASDCDRMSLLDAEAPGELRVATSSLLGSFECGSGADQIERLSITLQGETATTREVPCGEEAVFTGLAGDQHLSLSVSAFATGSTEVSAGASCRASTIAGSLVLAECTRLSALGTLRLDLVAALDVAGLACDAELAALRIKLPTEAKERVLVPPACLQPLDLGFPVGAAVVTVTAEPKQGEPVVLSCHAEIAPGSLVSAQCERAASE